MDFRKSGIQIFLAILAAAGVCAPAGAETLDWKMCVERANRDHPAVQAARSALVSAEADVVSSRATYLPDVDGSASHSRAHGSSSTDNYSYGVSASQRIYPGLTDQPEVARAKIRLDAARADLDATEATVRLELKSAYAELLYAQSFVALAETIAMRRQENVKLVKARFDAGREHRGSFLRGKAQSDQAAFELRQARRALKVAQRNLLNAMGQDTWAAVRVAQPLSVPRVPESVDLLRAADQSPEVRSAEADRGAAELGIVIARRVFHPTISASASASRSAKSWPPRTQSGEWTGNFSMSVPLFKGGSEKSDVRAAVADAEQQAAATRDVRQDVISTLESRMADLADAVENVSIRENFLEAAQMRAEIAQAQYTSGLLSFEDWDIIENDLITQQKSTLAAGRDATNAEARWEETIGRGFGE